MSKFPVPRQTQVAIRNDQSIQIGSDATREIYIRQWCDVAKKHAVDIFNPLHHLALPLDVITDYEDIVEFALIADNERIEWTLDFLYKHQQQWNCHLRNKHTHWGGTKLFRHLRPEPKNVNCWYFLSRNNSLPWTNKLLEAYEGFWDWEQLSYLTAFPWSEEVILKHIDRIGINGFFENPSFSFSKDFILTHGLDFITEFTNCWDLDLLDFYFNYDDDELDNWFQEGWISHIAQLPWNMNIIEIFKERWDWFILSGNEGLPWTKELIESYQDLWGWNLLSYNAAIPWDVEFIDIYKERLNWSSLSSNKGLPWCNELIDRYHDDWDWKKISRYLPNQLWNEDLIIEHFDNVDWDEISLNEHILWSNEIMSRFSDQLNWGNLSKNKSVYWDGDMLKKYSERLDWGKIILNKNIKWTPKIMNNFADKIIWPDLDWSFLEVDKELLDKFSRVVFREIWKAKHTKTPSQKNP